MILAFVPEVIIVLNKVSILTPQKELLKLITKSVFILGLLGIALSKDKIEDEMTFEIRLRAMAWAFLTGVFIVIIKPFVEIFLLGTANVITGFYVVVLMLIFYLLMYYFLKLKR